MRTGFALFLLLFTLPTLAQPTLFPREILRRTVAESGGSAWQQPETLVLKGEATFTPYGQTDEQLYFDDYAMYRVFPSENQAAHQANGKVRFDARSGRDVFMHLIFDGKITKNHLSEMAKPYQKHFSWSNNFGFSIIRFADQPGYRVTRLTDDQIEGFPCFVVQIIDPKRMVTNFWIDQKSYLIRSVAFTTDVGYHHRIYSDFERERLGGGEFFIQPTRVRLYFDGLKWMDINWKEVAVNKRIKESVFE